MRALFPETYTLKPASSGFTLLLAALVAAIVLSVATSIFEIAHKQLQLSSVARQSEYAFYAADTGAECALYWDNRFSYFGTSDPPGLAGVTPLCAGQSIALAAARPTSLPYTINFEFNSNGYCVDVYVTKSPGSVTGTVDTVIRADGFNVPCVAVPTSDVALERTVQLQY